MCIKGLHQQQLHLQLCSARTAQLPVTAAAEDQYQRLLAAPNTNLPPAGKNSQT
jgi:hypothetical protein